MTILEDHLVKHYNLSTEQGLENILEDIHSLREARFQGKDTSFISCILIDFERIYAKTKLTSRQREILFLRIEYGLNRREIEEYLNRSQQSVAQLMQRTIERLIKTAKEDKENEF